MKHVGMDVHSRTTEVCFSIGRLVLYLLAGARLGLH
jgi:hypothetical protein